MAEEEEASAVVASVEAVLAEEVPAAAGQAAAGNFKIFLAPIAKNNML